VSIFPIAQAAPLIPAALAAGKVATKAAGSFAEMLRNALVPSPTAAASVSPHPGNAVDANWPGELSSLIRDFASAFQDLLSRNGLASDSPVRLQLDDQGDVKVAGDHPQGLAIESLLAKTQTLSELFRTIAAKAAAHRKEQEFAAFQADSRSGTEDFPLLFSKDHAPRFEMQLKGESATAAFV
jgi:hypothetical protein